MSFTYGTAKAIQEKNQCNAEDCSKAQVIGSEYCPDHASGKPEET